MPRLICQLRGWGAVRNPLNEEESIPVEDGVVEVDDEELAEALDSTYDNLVPEADLESEGEDGDTDAEATAPTDDSFDAEAFVGDHWRDVATAIEDGEVDDHLDAIREAEESRDGGPREKSVIEALDEREAALDEE